MSTVFSCKTKDSQLKTKLEQYARANGLPKSKAIEKLLNHALKEEERRLPSKEKNEVYAGIPKDCKEVNDLLCKLAEVEAKSRELRLMLKKREGRNA
jgi:hypothetical protein